MNTILPELLELIVELSDDKSCVYLLMILRSPLLGRQSYLKNKFQVKYVGVYQTDYTLPNGEFHRENDLPAVIWEWRYNEKFHIANYQHALIQLNGTKEWYYNGKRHRENDQPAVIKSNGTKEWYYNGKRHRENDQPAIIWYNDDSKWYYNGKLHRENDQPAVIQSNGIRKWYYRGKYVRKP